MAKKIEVFASEAQQGELENFPDIKRGWGITKSKTGGIPPMRWYNAIQKRTDESINQVAKESINGYTFKDGGVVSSQNDWFEHEGNFYYRKSGFPYTVEAGKTPEADGGVWSESNPEGLWVDVGDNSLRLDILSGDGSMIGIGGGESLKSYVSSLRTFADISDLTSSKHKGLALVTSYKSGYVATVMGALGGGEFTYVDGKTDVDNVTTFKSKTLSGYYKRINYDVVDAAMAGMRPDNQEAENDDCISDLIKYCVKNNTGFTVHGIHRISSLISTNGVAYIVGGHRQYDGFKWGKLGSKGIDWVNKTDARTICRLENLRIEGPASRLINDDSVGLSGAPYTARGVSLSIVGWGIGHHVHSAVDCTLHHIWFENNYSGTRVEGFLNANNFSTTVSYSNTEWHGNFNGIVFGDKGIQGSSGASIALMNFHNCIWEKNTNNGIHCPSDGTSLPARQLTFTGYAWFERNGGLAYDLSNAVGVSWMGYRRFEGGQDYIEGRTTGYASHLGFQSGSLKIKDARHSNYTTLSVQDTYDGYQSNDAALSSHTVTTAGKVVASSEFVQSLDQSVAGRATGWRVKLKSEREDEATSKAYLNHLGNLTLKGVVQTQGLDYAEWFGKASLFDDGEVLLGIDSNGMATTAFDDAVTFRLASKNPSFVGGYDWFHEKTPTRDDFNSEEEYETAYQDHERMEEQQRYGMVLLALCGQVEISVSAIAGMHLIPKRGSDGGIVLSFSKPNTLDEYMLSVGQVISTRRDKSVVLLK